MADHTNEFIKVLREELKKELPPRDHHITHVLERHGMPPAMVLSRLARFSRHHGTEETWLDMARIVYEQWEAETYPEIISDTSEPS